MKKIILGLVFSSMLLTGCSADTHAAKIQDKIDELELKRDGLQDELDFENATGEASSSAVDDPQAEIDKLDEEISDLKDKIGSEQSSKSSAEKKDTSENDSTSDLLATSYGITADNEIYGDDKNYANISGTVSDSAIDGDKMYLIDTEDGIVHGASEIYDDNSFSISCNMQGLDNRDVILTNDSDITFPVVDDTTNIKNRLDLVFMSNPDAESTSNSSSTTETETSITESSSSAPDSINETSESESSQDDIPIEYESALKQAEGYSDTMHMSKNAIYDQLTSEYGGQFPAEAAQYAVDNLDVDYNYNALKQAEGYQDTMSMSTEAIRDQLTSEYGGQFTPEEAEYAVNNLNK